jgi:uncharacterized hydrophobic protein (TIGR00271 family)
LLLRAAVGRIANGAEAAFERMSAHRHFSPHLRDRLGAAFGITPEGRTATVRDMLGRQGRHPATYWLQLLLAMLIATLGLVLSSVGVVIGAMLISPLMGPIVDLAMGLAIGSSLLVIRASVRTAVSVVVVVGSAALVTLALPFQSITSEIAARTSPTALDLLVAVGCALAAAVTTARPSSETASAASGTAIAIALVPPLCVVGFGLGTGQGHVARGAALLFTANLCAILLFALITFLLFGFDGVEIGALEGEQLAAHGRAPARAAGGLQRLFGSRYSLAVRVLTPLLLSAVVYLPLSRALREVSWEVRVRTQVRGILQGSAAARGAVQSSVSVEAGAVRVRLVILGPPEQASALRDDLTASIGAVAGVEPSVDVLAVPDAGTLRAAMLRAMPDDVDVVRSPKLPDARAPLAAALTGAWPASAAGPLLRWAVDWTDEARAVVEVVHLGPPLGRAAERLLGGALATSTGEAVDVRDVALPAEPVTAASGEAGPWLAAFARATAALGAYDGLFACAEVPARAAEAERRAPKPPAKASAKAQATDVAVLEAARALAAQADAARLTLRPVDAERWSLRLQAGPCEGDRPPTNTPTAGVRGGPVGVPQAGPSPVPTGSEGPAGAPSGSAPAGRPPVKDVPGVATPSARRDEGRPTTQ